MSLVSKRISLVAITAGASLLGLESAARAATSDAASAAAPSSEVTLEEVVVTATRHAENLKDVPMSVDVVTGTQLQKLNVFDTKDISQLAPGLELTNTVGRNNTTTLRGISFDPDQGTSPAVQVYLNEIATDAQTVYTALYDIGQIEVLRGPQGLLRGTSAPAGAITIATKRPGFDKLEGYVSATGGDQNTYNVQAAVTLPLSETFALRVAALGDGNRLNDVYNVTRKDHSESSTQSGRLTLGFKPNDQFSAFLTYQDLRADNRQYQQVLGAGNTPTLAPLQVAAGPGGLPIVIFVPSTQRSGPAATVDDRIAVAQLENRYRNDSQLANLALDWNLGFATASFTGAHQHSVLNQARSLDPGNALVDTAFPSTLVIPYVVNTGELRLTSNNSGGLGWGIGAYYSKQTGTTTVDQDNNFYDDGAGNIPVALTNNMYIPVQTHTVVPTDTSTKSFNANLNYRVGAFRIEGGLRYSIIHTLQTTTIDISSPGAGYLFNIGPVFPGTNGYLVLPPPTSPPFSFSLVGVPPALQNHSDKPVTGGLTASYDFTPDVTGYLAYGHAFRAGTTGVAAPAGLSSDILQTHSEKTDSYEAGVKANLLDRRLYGTVAVFYQKIDGYLARFTSLYYTGAAGLTPTGFFDFNYNGNATSKGIEASLDSRLTRDWDLSLNLAYVHARYDHARLPCNDFAGIGSPNASGTPTVQGTGNVSYCLSSGRLANAPDFSLTANTEMRFPVGNLTPFVSALLSYRPSMYSQTDLYQYDSRELVNLFLGLRGSEDKWEVKAYAKNVFDQEKVTSYSLGTARVGPYDSGYHLISSTTPRQFGLSASVKF